MKIKPSIHQANLNTSTAKTARPNHGVEGTFSNQYLIQMPVRITSVHPINDHGRIRCQLSSGKSISNLNHQMKNPQMTNPEMVDPQISNPQKSTAYQMRRQTKCWPIEI
ncbi:hypothetical protein JCM33374_g4497 [Metschnikowia sp. JCM 33374]|nr:hypothetical protein JCM33374_g4497 [Metschnikowia sp. JCM 33374]